MINIAEKTKNLKQVTKDNSNWNLYADENNYLWSIAVNEGYSDSVFGNVRHLISVIYRYNAFKKQDFTEYGIELIKSNLGNFKLEDVFKQNKHI